MFSIGILGFVVWSLMVGLFLSYFEVINFAISQNIFMEDSTILRKLLFSLSSNNLFCQLGQLADNLYFSYTFSEITRGDFFNNLVWAYYETTMPFTLSADLKMNTLLLAGVYTKGETKDSASPKSVESGKSLVDVDPNWLQWFIGFVEGDGSLSCAKNGRLSFIVTQDEKAILYHIQSVLGIGSVFFDRGVQSWRYRVGDIASIFELAKLFNGNLFLKHRIEQLSNWIKILNSKGYNINLINKPTNISLQNGWLSGFCDAEACFNVTIYARAAMRVGFRVVLRFLIDQNDQDALLRIRDLFGSGNVALRKETSGCYRYTSDAFTTLQPVVDYFKVFPLRTVKKEAFVKWSDIRSMMLNKDHTTFEGFDKIKVLAKLVNDKSGMDQ